MNVLGHDYDVHIRGHVLLNAHVRINIRTYTHICTRTYTHLCTTHIYPLFVSVSVHVSMPMINMFVFCVCVCEIVYRWMDGKKDN